MASAPSARKRSPPARLGLWLLGVLWPAVAVFLGAAALLWGRAEPAVVWAVSGAAAVVFLVLFGALRRRARAAGRSVGEALRGFLFALAVAAVVVLAAWLLLRRG